MKILHSAALLRPPAGILNQMQWEHESARNGDLPWDVRMYCPQGAAPESDSVVHCADVQADPKSSIQKARDWVALRRGYHRWLFAQQGNYDAFLLRYYVHDPFQLAFVRRVDRPVFFVNHTLEVPELASASAAAAFARSNLERLLGPSTLRRATGIISVTDEIASYEAERAKRIKSEPIIYPNGIFYSQPPAKDRRGKRPELMFVASGYSSWHGLDLLFSSIRQSSQEFVLHVVGTVSPDLAASAKGDHRIRLHGQLDLPAITEIAAQCHVGLSSFALFRKNMTQACTLKVREYLMLGLPVYSGHDDIFPNSFPYYRCGECDIASIIVYADAMKSVPRCDVAEMARPYVDKKRLLFGLYDKIKKQLLLGG